jgi:ribose transport system substrate-binding protein
MWGPMTAGAAQVIKNAGKLDQVKVYVASDGQPGDCDLLEQGLFTSLMSYRANIQGETIVDAVLTLLQDERPAGSQKYVYNSTSYRADGPEDRAYCYTVRK